MKLPKSTIRDTGTQQKIILLLFAIIIGLFIIGELISPGFSSFKHFKDVVRTVSFVGVSAVGQTLVILTGGIDLTIGSLITMGQIFGCLFVKGDDANLLWAFLSILVLGGIFGIISVVGESYLKISPLVMTLAVSSLVDGVTLLVINGAPKGVASPILEKLGAGMTWGLPTMMWIWIGISIITIVFLRKTIIGRQIYYVGTNVTAAKFSGIKINKVRVLVYVLSGICSALTGLLLAGNTSRAFLDIGKEYTMWTITAVVIGGTSMAGGSGGYLGTAAGAFIIITLEGLLTVVNIPEAGRKIAMGLIILIMIMIYYRRDRR